MTTETLLTILTGLGAAAGAVWALVAKILPKIVEAQIADRESDREAARDRREHRQAVEEKLLEMDLLERSVATDKMTALLEMDASFIREVVYKKLDSIEAMVKTLTYRMDQTRDVLVILNSIISEVRDELNEAHNDEEES